MQKSGVRFGSETARVTVVFAAKEPLFEAPMPFRVSGDGKAVAILAGQETGSATHVDNMSHNVWVDYQGTLFKKLTTVRRHSPQGGSRGYSLARGPKTYNHWGKFSGPLSVERRAHRVVGHVRRCNGLSDRPRHRDFDQVGRFLRHPMRTER